MADLLLDQEPITVLADSPTIVGTNDGTLWNSNATLTFVGLQTDTTPRQDWAAADITAAATGPISGGKLVFSANYDSVVDGELQTLLWHVSGPSWDLEGSWQLPSPEGTRHWSEWVFVNGDPAVTYSGAFSGGISYSTLAADIAAGNVTIDAKTGFVPGQGTITLHVYQMWVTAGLPPIVQVFPRDDGRGLSSAPQVYPESKATRVYGGIQ